MARAVECVSRPRHCRVSWCEGQNFARRTRQEGPLARCLFMILAGVPPGGSASPAAQHPEERLDVRVGPHISIAVEVGGAGARGWRARARDAGEKSLDVTVGADVPIAVVIRAP